MAAGLGRRAAALIRARSSPATLRRQSTVLAASVLAASISAGATTTTIKAAGSGKLTGDVVAGATFTITGISGTYTVTEDRETTAAGILTLVFSPAIQSGQSAAIGAAFTFAQRHMDIACWAVSRQADAEDTKAIEEGLVIKLIPYDAAIPTPRVNDLIDGDPIRRVRTVDADDGIAFWRCHVTLNP